MQPILLNKIKQKLGLRSVDNMKMEITTMKFRDLDTCLDVTDFALRKILSSSIVKLEHLASLANIPSQELASEFNYTYNRGNVVA